MLKDTYPYYLAGKAACPNANLAVLDKYRRTVAARVALAGSEAIEQAIAAAAAAVGPMWQLPAWRRQKVLEHCARRFGEQAEDLATALCIETGKPIRDSRGEVTRLIDTFRIAAEESVRIPGEFMSFDRSARTSGYVAQSKRVPIGAVLVYCAVQLPVEPSGAQGRPGHRGGLPVRAQAVAVHAAGLADHRGDAG